MRANKATNPKWRLAFDRKQTQQKMILDKKKQI